MRDLLKLPGKLLETLKPARVKSYLLGSGWQAGQVVAQGMAEAMVAPRGGGTAFLPLDSSFGDYAERMADLVLTLAAAEERAPWAVLNDLLLPDGDILRFRIAAHFAEGGTVPLKLGTSLVVNGRKTIGAVADSLQSPQAVFINERFPDTRDLLEKCRLGQTELGSFVVSVVIPVTPPNLFFPEEPFARRVSRHVMIALGQVKIGATALSASSIVDHAGSGISANLCEALENMQPSGAGAELEVAVRWSGALTELPKETPSSVTFNKSDFRIIGDAVKIMKSESVEENVRIEGFVTDIQAHVKHDQVQHGIVQIHRMDDKNGTVKVKLGEADYTKAAYAISAKKRVCVVGKLTKASGEPVPRIREYRLFDILGA